MSTFNISVYLDIVVLFTFECRIYTCNKVFLHTVEVFLLKYMIWVLHWIYQKFVQFLVSPVKYV